MAIVAFPTDYNLERSSSFDHLNNVIVDFMDDGEPRQRTLGATQYVTIDCSFNHLFTAEKDTLVSFLKLNAANTITWTIDSVDYSGIVLGGHQLTMVGSLFNVNFKYYASEV